MLTLHRKAGEDLLSFTIKNLISELHLLEGYRYYRNYLIILCSNNFVASWCGPGTPVAETIAREDQKINALYQTCR